MSRILESSPSILSKELRLFQYDYRELLQNFNNRNIIGRPFGELLSFNLVRNSESTTVYNPAPVVIGGQTYLWARVEEITKETDSTVRLFKEGKNNEWDLVEEIPPIKDLQDPFYSGKIEEHHVLGGVQAYRVDGSSELGYRSVFYRYKKSFSELIDQKGDIIKPFATGPDKMKGIRLIQIEKGRIGVFTRPQGSKRGEFGERGRIGYFEIDSLDRLEDALRDYDRQKNRETLIDSLFVDERGLRDEQWGGVNQLFILPDGKIGVLGHIAGFSHPDQANSPKDYYPITFIFDPKNRSVSNIQIIATPEQFPKVKPKKADIGKVLYSGSMVGLGDGTAMFYTGLEDSASGRILIEDPFWNKRVPDSISLASLALI